MGKVDDANGGFVLLLSQHQMTHLSVSAEHNFERVSLNVKQLRSPKTFRSKLSVLPQRNFRLSVNVDPADAMLHLVSVLTGTKSIVCLHPEVDIF